MNITVKYTEYAGVMERRFETVKGTYDPDQKTVEIKINIDDALVEYIKFLTMTDEEITKKQLEVGGEELTADQIAESRKSVLNLFKDAYGWNEKITMAVASHI